MSYSKVFFHTAAPCRNCGGLGDMHAALDAAAIPFGVYGVNDGGHVAAAMRYEHAGPVIYRDLNFDYVPYHVQADAMKGVEYWRQIEAKLPPEVIAHKDRIWIEVFNEPDRERAEAVGRWQYHLATAAIARGFKFCGPGWSTGTPERDAWTGTWMRKYLDLCAVSPDRCAVTLHEYSLDAGLIISGAPYLVGRFQFLLDACDEMGIARPTVFITEAGWTHNAMPPAKNAMDDIDWLAGYYAAHPEIKAAFLWTLTGGGDKVQLGRELAALVKPVTEYALTTRFPDAAEPPKPPATPPGNLLVNPSFEDGWTDSGKYTTTQNPDGWMVEWNAGAVYRNPHSEWEYQVGEAVHKSRAMLPVSERETFVWDGEWTFKVFAGNRAFWARLKQDLDLPAGRYRLTTPVWVDCYRWEGGKDYDVEPYQCETLVKVNDRHIGDWRYLVAGRRNSPAVEFDHTGGGLKLAVHLRCNWPISNNLWLDGWNLQAVEVAEPEPEPPPPPPPTTEDKPVVDISHHQGRVNWDVLAGKVAAVIIRAGNGLTEDREARRNCGEAIRLGVPFAVYHYWQPGVDPKAQGAYFGKLARELAPGRLCCVDLEEQDGNPTASRAQAYIDAVADAVDHDPMIYTSAGYWRGVLGSPDWGADYLLWIAAWTTASRPAVPSPFTGWTLWQYAVRDIKPSEWGVQSARLDFNRLVPTVEADEFFAPDWYGKPEGANAQLWQAGQDGKLIGRHPTFALEAAMLDDGYYPVGNETRVTAGDVAYAIHLGADAEGDERLYVARAGAWGEIWYIDGTDAAPEPEPPPQADDAIDLLPYIKGDGRLYEVRHPSGATETFQTQSDGANFWLVKNSQYESFRVDDNYIWRGVDTSPGGGRYYQQAEPLRDMARWCPRFMSPGQSWEGPGHNVQFYLKADCSKSALNSGWAVNRISFGQHYDSITMNGITVPDVVELTNGTETWLFARGFGLVSWRSPWGASEIVEVFAPGQRPDNVRETIPCLK